MNTNKTVEIIHEFQKQLWVDRVNQARVAGDLATWVSSLHPEKLPCELDGNKFLNGSYNLNQKLRFSDDTTLVLRMPIVGNVCDKFADEKIAMEVEVLCLLRGVDIPVPRVVNWGLAIDNPLGLGPFILMTFIEGVSVNTLLRKQDETRLLKEDISEVDLRFLYRQFARILLQLFQMEFPVLGSLPTPVTQFKAPVRPLTFKLHDILQTGGVNTFGDRAKGFSGTADYFSYLTSQDWSQFQFQPNSGGGPSVTRAKYAALHALQAVAPQLVEPRYANSANKLICDDLGLANLIVRSAHDLTVVGVVDLEWSYAGPAQMFGSAPWWLLQDRLNNWDNFLDGEEAPRVLQRYLRYLDMFKTVLEEEEAQMGGAQNMELSRLVKWSEESGSMWLHMLLSWGFNHPDSVPFTQLRVHLEQERWEKLEEGFNEAEARDLIEQKRDELNKYDEQVEKMETLQDGVADGKMTREAFIAVMSEVISGFKDGSTMSLTQDHPAK